MLGSSAHEAEILTQILALKDDPVGFIHYAIPWGRAGTPFEKFSGPRRWQQEELKAIADYLATLPSDMHTVPLNRFR